MNPHKESWHLANAPVALLFAVSTFIGLLFTKDRKTVYVTRETVVLMAFMFSQTVTYFVFAMNAEDSWNLYTRTMKIDLMVLVTLIALQNRRHLIAFVWVIVVSIGFYGFKGGIFTIAHGGVYRVWGPKDSFIEGNNELALALIMIVPLMRFLQLQVKNLWLKRFLTLWMLLAVTSVLGSQSRGALLAVVAMALVMWSRSKRKVVTAVAFVVIGASLAAFMPDSWHKRMETTQTYQKDESAMGRINTWQMNWNLVKEHPMGGSYSIYTPANFWLYAPNPEDIHVAHSIYFSVLGEQGYPGLILFLALWFMTWGTAGKLRKEGRRRPETLWLSDLAAMCQVSLAGYAVGGAFLSLAYFDLPYNIMILVVMGQRWVKEKAWESEPVLVGRFARIEEAFGMGRPA